MTRKGKIGVAVKRWPVAPRLLFTAALLSFCGSGHAVGGDPASVGVACSVGAPFWAPPAATAEDLPWASVWLGHFSGGRPYKDARYGLTLIDWLDLKVCFPTRRGCQAWTARLRRAYHRPEGYWTCLLLR
ncbi:MAG: hypothetical protein ACREC9_00565 [Methylocella sp.]